MADKLARKVTDRYLMAREFPTSEALKKYLREHPKADRSKHTVTEKKDKPKENGKKESPKALFPDTSDLPKEVKQKVKDPDDLFKAASKAHEQQLDLLDRGKGLDKSIGAKVIRVDKGDEIDFDKPGPVIVIGPMKKRDRSKEKVDADFGGDWARLGDIVRSSVAVDSMDQLEDVVAKLKKAGIKLARQPKDRFGKPTEAGYRDMLLSVEYPNGHVGEMQLHLKPILKAKDAGHKFYEDVRSIEAKAKKEGRKELTDEEMAIIKKANDQMKALYDEAWEKATGRAKEASLPLHMRVFMAAKTTYYDWDGLPAVWEFKRFPEKTTPKGKKTVYELQKFFMEATPITKAEYDELVKSSKKS